MVTHNSESDLPLNKSHQKIFSGVLDKAVSERMDLTINVGSNYKAPVVLKLPKGYKVRYQPISF